MPAVQVAALEKSVAPICADTPALHLSARRLGFFPGPQHPRVLWAGADDRDGRLPALHRQLDTALNWLTPTEPQFTGHITLGRFKPGHHSAILQLVELATRLGDRDFGEWQAGTVELVRSDLTATGATHTPIASFPLV